MAFTPRTYLYSLLARYFAEYIPPAASVAEIGLEGRSLLPLLSKAKGGAFAHLDASRIGNAGPIFAEGNYPERIILNGVLHYEPDVQGFLERLHQHSPTHARLLITYYSMLWRPLFSLATRLGIRDAKRDENWLSASDVDNLLTVSGYQPVVRHARVLMPVYVPIVSELFNRWIAPLPGIRSLSLVQFVVAKPATADGRPGNPSVSIVVPARNEAGNIEALLRAAWEGKEPA